jgi:hypothetical protein
MDIITSTFKDIAQVSGSMGRVFSAVWFIVLPPLFYWAFKLFWMDHIQRKFLKSIDFVLLEIIPPQNIEKSPKIMESFYVGIAGILTTFTTFQIYLKGMLFENFSMELVSDEGKLHMYIRAPRSYLSIIESNLYAHYPDVELIEVPDYVNEVPRIVPNRDWDLWGADIILANPNPLPIKTYQKFEETVTGKMIDPMSSFLEIFGRIGLNQKIWLQIIIVQEKQDWNKAMKEFIQVWVGRKKKSKSKAEEFFGDLGDVFSNVFRGIFQEPKFKESKEDKKEDPLEFRLTPVEKDTLKAMEENAGKVFFKVKMRFISLGKVGYFSKPSTVSPFFGALNQFADANSNTLVPEDSTKTYAWYVFEKSRLRYRQRKIFQRYVERDPTGPKFLFSSTELATIFHLPDMSVMTPNLNRVLAKKGGAPSNLPVE